MDYNTDIQRTWGRGSSVGRASDWKARRNTDAGSSPRCGKGFFSQSQLPVKTLLRCPYSPPCAVACTNICAHVKNLKHWQSYHCLDTRMWEGTSRSKILHTLVGMGSAALATAVPYPGMATSVSCKGQRSTFFFKSSIRRCFSYFSSMLWYSVFLCSSWSDPSISRHQPRLCVRVFL